MFKNNPLQKNTSEDPQNSWEIGFGKLMTPLERFIKGETNSGMLLVVCTIIALLIANSPLFHQYEEFLAQKWQIGSADHPLSFSLHHWINDGLMTLFFFLVGLEIKREILVGELSELRKALLPILAAVGGMVVPALFYYGLNIGSHGEAGWGIPMATDIAFAVTALVLLGKRVPKSLMTFLIALAIVDDMGAVLVIAIFYTADIHWLSLIYAAAVFGLMLILNIAGVRKSYIYGALGVALWVLMYHSGIHATVAGILTAMAIPARPRYKVQIFAEGARELLGRFDSVEQDATGGILKNSGMAATLQTLKNGINKAQTPLQNLEHSLHLPVNFLVIPIFALANAAIPVDFSTINVVMTDSTTLGVIVGLIFGKPVGIALATWLSVKLGICKMPANTTMHHIIGTGFLAGIGFTMSIFITELAFGGDKQLLIYAKTGILFASIVAGLVGYIYLYCLHMKNNPNTFK